MGTVYSRIGYEIILNKSKSKVFQILVQIALRYHERYNSKGYAGEHFTPRKIDAFIELRN
jgi:response regulator RpfG family c-di-GMP phosphodiesterase